MKLLECWTRILIYLSPSPYFVTKYMLIVEKVMREIEQIKITCLGGRM